MTSRIYTLIIKYITKLCLVPKEEFSTTKIVLLIVQISLELVVLDLGKYAGVVLE